MFPAAFDYRAPASLDEALGLLAQQGDAAKVMAGGQSLIPLLKLRFAQPGMLIDIGRMRGLTGVSRNNGWIIHTAAVRWKSWVMHNSPGAPRRAPRRGPSTRRPLPERKRTAA